VIARILLVLLILFAFRPVHAAAVDDKVAASLYAARVSSEEGWEDVFIDPLLAEYVDAYLLAAALSRDYASFRDDAVRLETEVQTVYYFGRQEYWEFNAVPLMVRWRRFPWSHTVATTTAFGLGLSYTTRLPEIEVELEGESHQTLVYWVAEITAGLPDKPWAVSLRLHHRSVAYGLMGDEGGLNAVGLGLRWQF
jgi:hypothetical protein